MPEEKSKLNHIANFLSALGKEQQITEQIKTKLVANANLSRKNIFVSNLIGGLAWGFGTVIGATLVVALLVTGLKLAGFIPGVSDITNSVLQTIDQRQQQIKNR